MCLIVFLQEKWTLNKPEFKNWFYVYKNYSIDQNYKNILIENYLTEVRSVDRVHIELSFDLDSSAEIKPVPTKETPTEEDVNEKEKKKVEKEDNEKQASEENLNKKVQKVDNKKQDSEEKKPLLEEEKKKENDSKKVQTKDDKKQISDENEFEDDKITQASGRKDNKHQDIASILSANKIVGRNTSGKKIINLFCNFIIKELKIYYYQ